MFDDRQAQAGAAAFARAGAVHAVEPLKNPAHGLGRNARTVIGHKYLQFVGLAAAGPDGDAAPVSSIFDRVFDQVEQDLLNAVGIGPDEGLRGDFIFENGLAGGGARAEVIQDAPGQVVQINRLGIQGGLAGFQMRNGQQIFDEKKEAVGVFVDFLQEPHGLRRIILGPVEQGLGEALDEGKRGAQFVADIADKFLADILQLFQAGDIVENEQLPRPGRRRGRGRWRR